MTWQHGACQPCKMNPCKQGFHCVEDPILFDMFSCDDKRPSEAKFQTATHVQPPAQANVLEVEKKAPASSESSDVDITGQTIADFMFRQQQLQQLGDSSSETAAPGVEEPGARMFLSDDKAVSTNSPDGLQKDLVLEDMAAKESSREDGLASVKNKPTPPVENKGVVHPLLPVVPIPEDLAPASIAAHSLLPGVSTPEFVAPPTPGFRYPGVFVSQIWPSSELTAAVSYPEYNAAANSFGDHPRPDPVFSYSAPAPAGPPGPVFGRDHFSRFDIAHSAHGFSAAFLNDFPELALTILNPQTQLANPFDKTLRPREGT